MFADPTPPPGRFPRPWDTPAPGYLPADITPPELTGAGLAASVADGWAEPGETPFDVTDWPERQTAALVPFPLTAGMLPLNPAGRTGRVGRALGHWGENAAADAIVIADTGTERWLLMIRRSDCGLWALPGGKADPGERPRQTAVRELAEETGLDLEGHVSTEIWRGVVDGDPRNSDWAWMATTAHLFRVRVNQLPEVAGWDDATEAKWWPCDGKGMLHLVDRLGRARVLFTAHLPLLWTAHRHLADGSPLAAPVVGPGTTGGTEDRP
ncbi:NUDIX domain-containing protein [Actinoplanes sp. NEAU-A12]|uniref:NUDIX domain-containing protein n=1 Tax=Actinoplanes sandaracinus TaxID=3045177 RepID=A0ABT6WQ76_9ACTN|nr:NUDIX domain-containing protein [Actinoplanes sandaracinus]MDI6101887.1 NUDIX domain-containing protein [Actinoplanes sandaracinus]